MSDDALAEYRRKRDLDLTPEPPGRPVQPDETTGADSAGRADTDVSEGGRFVIQQHSATRLHWDLRLEADGVLWSWALPRGLPWDPGRNNLAVHTEDHPVEYLTFEGDIPEGTYGAGHMFVWDHGTYELLSRKDGKVVVHLHGERAEGRYALFRTGAERDWMIHRMDPPADPGRAWPPDPPPLPMTARPGEAVDGDDWAWEVRLSGLRVMITLLPGMVRIHDAKGDDLSDWFLDVRRVGRVTGSVETVLDGVIESEGGRLERRLNAAPTTRRRLADTAPVRFVAFDLVWLEGHPRWDVPWDQRRADLEAMGLDGPSWSTSTAHIGDGLALHAAAAQRGVTGLVGKRRAAPYQPGKTSDDWIDVRIT